MSVQVTVDGQPANPNAGTDFAMCTANNSLDNNFVGATRVATFVVPTKGQHTVAVQGAGMGATEWWAGDSTLVVSAGGKVEDNDVGDDHGNHGGTDN